jgi:uncharacterized membrane protein YphA (DoxX/SURF4 family)
MWSHGAHGLCGMRPMIVCLFVAIRWAVSLVWIAAGLGKASRAAAVESRVRDYGVLPDRLVAPVATVLPLAELALGVVLAVGVLPGVAGGVAAGCFCALAGVIAWNLAHGRTFDCGCGFVEGTPISWRLTARNLALAGISAAVALGPSGALCSVPGTSHEPSGAPTTAALIAIPMIVLMVAVMARLLATIRPLTLIQDAQIFRSTRETGNGLSIAYVDATGTRREGAQ